MSGMSYSFDMRVFACLVDVLSVVVKSATSKVQTWVRQSFKQKDYIEATCR